MAKQLNFQDIERENLKSRKLGIFWLSKIRRIC